MIEAGDKAGTDGGEIAHDEHDRNHRGCGSWRKRRRVSAGRGDYRQPALLAAACVPQVATPRYLQEPQQIPAVVSVMP